MAGDVLQQLEFVEEARAALQRVNLTSLEAAVWQPKYDGYTEKDMATMLDRPSVGSVKQAYSRACTKLARAINP
jgi:DNA-directed RNA polymerase specialized sigma24 family protein